MKRHRGSHGSRSRDLAGGARGEMRLALGVPAVFVEEHRLDEQQIGAAQETCKSLPVAGVVGRIRDNIVGGPSELPAASVGRTDLRRQFECGR